MARTPGNRPQKPRKRAPGRPPRKATPAPTTATVAEPILTIPTPIPPEYADAEYAADSYAPPVAPAAPRHFSLDATRGFAVMGILLLNIIGFSMPEGAYINPRAWGGTGAVDIATWCVNQILFDGKFRGLFSLMFGASTLLVMERAAMGGRNPRNAHISRMAWLLAFGCVHFVALWWGDILRLYAVLGVALLFFVRRDPLSLVKAAFLFFLLHFTVSALLVASAWITGHAAAAPHAPASAIATYRGIVESFGLPSAAQVGQELALHRGPWHTLALHQFHRIVGDSISNLMFVGLDTFGFMLLGMAMLKSGFLTGGWAPEQYRRVARHCFLIGLPPMIALALWSILSGFDAVVTFGCFLAWSFPFRIPMVVGYAALFQWLATTHANSGIVIRVAAVGRAAFSNYLGTSLLMTATFYGWGLGLYGHVSRPQAYAFVALAWAIMLLWSKPWLDRFAYGPFEWLWRSLARGGIQPMRRATISH